jgi:hypothetical protein
LPAPWRGWLECASPATLDTAGPESATSRTHIAPPNVLQLAAPSRRESGIAADESPIYLGGAGAVLLHPFLPVLFRDRGLLDGSAFRDGAACQRAVRLIAQLVFGRDEVPEQELPIAKFLCGLQLEDALEPVILTPDDLEACEQLLRAVLTHWNALRSSSTHWLRSQFLLRDGKLEAVDEGWRLTIERRAQDVLLARLPWGFGVIELPWIAGRIFVRWLD